MNDNDINIILIHDAIMEKFKRDREMLPVYHKELEKYQEFIDNSDSIIDIENTKLKINELEEKIHNINTKNNESLYVASTFNYIEEYKAKSIIPVKLDFTGKLIKRNTDKENLNMPQLSTVQKYLIKSSDYIDISNFIIKQSKPPKTNKDTVCICGKKMKYVNDELVCASKGGCGIKSNELESFTTYKDIDRINIASNYQYVMRAHIKEHFYKFQGKQKTIIPEDLYKNLKTCIKEMGLDIKLVTERQLLIFMKQYGFSKYYEDINKIHYEITQKPLPDLAYLQDEVFKDIDAITNIYPEIKKPGRKNFINSQLTICMLLRRHGYNCSIRDFHSLRTVKHLKDHLEIYHKCEDRLGWKRTSFG